MTLTASRQTGFTSLVGDSPTIFEAPDHAPGGLRLYRYQREAIAAIDAGWPSVSSQVLASPTGSGKTAMASHFMRRVVDDGGTAWFVAHLVTLTDQSLDRFAEYGLDAGLVQAGNTHDTHKRALVCSGQTLKARDFARIGKDLKCDESLCVDGCDGKVCETLYAEEFDLSSAHLPDLLIIDESHHAYKYSRRLARAVVENGGRVLGLTATPYAGFMSLSYGRMVVGATTRRLVDMDALVPYRYFEAVQIFDMSTAGGRGEIRPANAKRRGEDADFTARQFEAAVQYDVLGDMPEEWVRNTSARFGGPVPTLIAAPTIKIGDGIAQAFNEHFAGYGDARYAGAKFEVCSALDGKDGRAATSDVLRRFDAGELTGLVSVAKLAIGFDRPAAQCLVLARPFATLTPYVQWLGRVIRTADGKEEALVLDHAGNLGRLGTQLMKHVNAGPPGLSRPPEPTALSAKQACACSVCGSLFLGRGAVCQLCVQSDESADLTVSMGQMQEVDFGFRDKEYVIADENARELWFVISGKMRQQFPDDADEAWRWARRVYSVLRTPVRHYMCKRQSVQACLAHPDAVRCAKGAPRDLDERAPAGELPPDVESLLDSRWLAWQESRDRLVSTAPRPTTFRCAKCLRMRRLDHAEGGTSPLSCHDCREELFDA